MNSIFKCQKNSIYITLIGNASKENIKEFKKKLYYLSKKYNNIVIDFKMVENQELLYDLFDEYNVTCKDSQIMIN